MQRSGNQYPVEKGATAYYTSVFLFYLLPQSLGTLEPFTLTEDIPAATPPAYLDYDKPTPPEVQAQL
ncbi:hypothetical protein [Coleofasciculus sp. F4-SAH-05]|uniref:hypothetical protein n=1 Tax=Coleofasciculus sp. F4-SAH-05 TaxID=3069525 RepID=UPI0032F2E7C6